MASEMKVLVCIKPGQLSQQRRPIPLPGTGEVLLKMCALGVCGSDIHAFHGRQPMMQYPAVLGHEISAEVVACGQDAALYQPGQQVVVIPYRHCGQCAACRRGRTTCCTALSVMGIHRTGAMQEYVTVAEDALVAVTGIPHLQAALIEPYAIAAHAVRRSGVTHGVSLLVVGAGAIGLGIADIGRSLGAEVIVAEADPQRQAFAAGQYGFTDVLNPLDTDFEQQLRVLTHGDGPQVIIDATGNPASMNSQVERIAAGGTLVFVGLHTGEVSFNDLAFHKRELELLGSRAADREDFIKVITLLQQGKISPEKLCTREIPFSELDQYQFEQLNQPGNVKSVILF
ncbi:zinc-binding alcohol dehydrogenase family protein [Serratia quinivorans]|uniref:zinc-binding alcohol dehydrogenase family protein n=1 Tax=Serratia quinivorans TaxID=137545 RepID=UPI0021BA90CD|nr:zinc-binding alcohol dehydrogenase family protein [Serratia quinivorans]